MLTRLSRLPARCSCPGDGGWVTHRLSAACEARLCARAEEKCVRATRATTVSSLHVSNFLRRVDATAVSVGHIDVSRKQEIRNARLEKQQHQH
eukprot:5700078-Pleurochrysis_carterae.AAC.1